MKSFLKSWFGPADDGPPEDPITLHPFEAQNPSEVDVLRHVYRHIAAAIRPGVSTNCIEATVAAVLKQTGAVGYFKGYRGFPNFISASVNQQILMTLPSARMLREGDLLKIQTGVNWRGRHAYVGWTFPIGTVSDRRRRLMAAGLEALDAARAVIRHGALVNEISNAMAHVIKAAGYSSNRDFVGYRIGEKATMEPAISCAPVTGLSKAKITRGMTLALIVILHEGGPQCRITADGWNVETKDGSDAVLFTQLVQVEEHGCHLLSDFPDAPAGG